MVWVRHITTMVTFEGPAIVHFSIKTAIGRGPQATLHARND
jgi:hypothetical protein